MFTCLQCVKNITGSINTAGSGVLFCTHFSQQVRRLNRNVTQRYSVGLLIFSLQSAVCSLRSVSVVFCLLPVSSIAVDVQCVHFFKDSSSWFLPRDAVHPRYYEPVSVSVCPSFCLCLSQVTVLLKRLNRGSHKQHHTIAQGFQCSDAKDLREIRPGSPLTGAPNTGGLGQNRRLSTNNRPYLENGTRQTHGFYADDLE